MASQNGVTELRSKRSGRDLNTPTSQPKPGALPVTVTAPARSRVFEQHRGRGGEDRKRRPGVRRAEVLDLPLLRGKR